jgi:hypothetical protein
VAEHEETVRQFGILQRAEAEVLLVYSRRAFSPIGSTTIMRRGLGQQRDQKGAYHSMHPTTAAIKRSATARQIPPIRNCSVVTLITPPAGTATTSAGP